MLRNIICLERKKRGWESIGKSDRNILKRASKRSVTKSKTRGWWLLYERERERERESFNPPINYNSRDHIGILVAQLVDK